MSIELSITTNLVSRHYFSNLRSIHGLPTSRRLWKVIAAGLSALQRMLVSGTSESRTEQPAEAAPKSESSAKTARILVVEDEGIVALHIKLTLARMGHKVIATVDTGEDAVVVAVEQRPDLILMDIRLKGALDGIDAVHAIQQRFTVPIIYLTGQLDESTVNRAQLTNPTGYLGKPFSVTELSALIQRILDQRGA